LIVFRPVIGRVFGLALYVVLNAGLIQIANVPELADTRVHFFMGLAFLAGFSERWAHDVLLPAGSQGIAGDLQNDSEAPVSPPSEDALDAAAGRPPLFNLSMRKHAGFGTIPAWAPACTIRSARPHDPVRADWLSRCTDQDVRRI
jgi:hypothetical protein